LDDLQIPYLTWSKVEETVMYVYRQGINIYDFKLSDVSTNKKKSYASEHYNMSSSVTLLPSKKMDNLFQ